jgi:tetratricopeptide (TPR) repeat protein
LKVFGLATGVFVILALGQTNIGAAQASNSPRTAARAPVSSLSTDEAKGRKLLERGEASKTITWLKQAIERHPDSKVLQWLLVRAYLRDGNNFWAFRTLNMLAQRFPSDCEPWLWTAWIQIQQGALEEAREALSSAKCRPKTPHSARKALLASMVEQHAKEQHRAKKHLEKARRADAVFAEDLDAIERQITMLDPGYIDPITAKLDLAFGWTSNATAASPVDPQSAREDASSPTGQAGLWLRLVAPTSRYLRPTVELDSRALGYTFEVGRSFSYLLMGGRPGLMIGDTTPNALIAYHYETYLLAGGDRYNEGPIWFYEAHRGEAEISLFSSLTLFGGVGRRIFRHYIRSRNEFDGGIGGNVSIDKTWRILGALTARGYIANKKVYDLIGGSALLSAEARLPERWSIRAGALLDYDAYPSSMGYFDEASKRIETALKISGSGFSPPIFEGVKIGLTYEYSQRFSSIASYDYTDHRILLKLLWNLSFDPFLPRAITPKGHVAIDYGFEAEEMEERIQDLLRRDESIQRGSSCVE